MSSPPPRYLRSALSQGLFARVPTAARLSSLTRRRRHYPRYAALGLLLSLAPGLLWGSIPTRFNGLTRVLPTGSTTLAAPSSVTVDTDGNIYIADTGNNRIVKIDARGTASVLGIAGISPALNSPVGIALDGSGILYVADTGNNRVVKVDSAGNGSVISTGSVTLLAPQGVAIDQSGNLFIADTGNSQIVEVTAGGSASALSITGLSGPSTLTGPIGLAIDTSGKLYIADCPNNRVVVVAAGGTSGSELSITGATLNTPMGVAVDGVGNIYVADTNNSRIVKVQPSGVGSVLNTGTVTLNRPWGVALDIYGTVYVADTVNNETIAVSLPAVGFGHLQLGADSAVTLTLPFSVSSGTALGAVKAFTSGAENLDFTVGPGTTCTVGDTPRSCTVDIQFFPTAGGLRRGAVVLYDNGTPQSPLVTVPLYGFSDAPIAALAPNAGTVIGTGGVITNYPFQLALDGTGNMYVGNYVQSNSNPKVVKISAGGGTASVVSTSPVTLGNSVTGVAIDGAGNLFIGDYYQNQIVVVTPGGIASVLSISGLSPALGQPTELAFDGAGNLYIADYAASSRAYSRIVKVSSLAVRGSTSSGIGTVLSTGSYTFPSSTITGVAVGPNGTVYIAARTSNSSHVVQVTASGAASLLNPTGLSFSNPQGAFVDGMGNLYVQDSGNGRIVRITTSGVTSAISITGLTNPSTLSWGFGVAADSSGNLYISDWTNNRVVFVNVSGASLNFLSTKQGFTSTDSPKAASITNLGNQELVFSADPTFTADFPQASGSSNQCLSSTSVGPGTACQVSLKFTPQSVGSLSAGITVTNNTPNVSGTTQRISVSGVGLSPGDTTSVAVSANPPSASIGQPLTVTVILADTTTGHTSTIPTGAVTLTDAVGSTVVTLNGGNALALSGGIATLTGVTLTTAGTHTISANYAGVSGSFIPSTATTTLVVTNDTPTITGPTVQPVSIPAGQAGSAVVTVAGPYSVIAVPSGTLSYTILNATGTVVGSGTLVLTVGTINSSGTVPIPNTLAAGAYALNVLYSGDRNYLASSSATVIQLMVARLAPTVNWTPPSTISYGTSLSGLLNASAVNGSASVAGSFAYTAALQGGGTYAVTGTTAPSAGVYSISATFTPTDTTTYSTTTSTVSLTVTKSTPTLALVSSASPALMLGPVSFTASVWSTSSIPTGNVSFYDGSTLLGTVTLAQGIATYTTSSLAVGTHSIAAAYSGDSNYVASQGASIIQLVVAQPGTGPNISPGSVTSLTIDPGGTAAYALVIGPSNGGTLANPTTLSVTGLPPGAIATFTPPGLPAGSGPTSVTLVVTLPSQTAAQHNSSNKLFALALSAGPFGMVLLPFSSRRGRRKTSVKCSAVVCMLLALALVSLAAITGCGGSSQKPPTSYAITVTATSGSQSTNVTLNLEVQH